MPRLSYVTSESFMSGEQDNSPENENMDFCRDCWDKRIHLNYIPDDQDPNFVDEGRRR